MNSRDLHGIGMTSQRTRRRLVQRLEDEGIKNQDVLNIMSTTPRHLFVDEAMSHRAYEDISLPIGRGQTISQPYIVARMTEILLEAGSCNRILEIGTGSGFQTAILAQLFDKVYSIERIKALQDKARKQLMTLRLMNVEYRYGDGGEGWSEKSPFDAIIVTAAPPVLPRMLMQQLADGGHMVVPVGAVDGKQNLCLIQRVGDDFEKHILESVRFVPLLGGALE
ncbi:MAG: protein-L-isoaspartate(D-aspartate) O-methyltransferase [Gammaproteobacteria bacterium]|nr:protein-L-isoaspartate(D-aspartate) O-methyltransferase [Gammaproteobacteria bacterium]